MRSNPTQKEIDEAFQAALDLAEFSPQTSERLAEMRLILKPEYLDVSHAFIEIGRAIGSKRHPVSDKDLKRLMAEAERLIFAGNSFASNCIGVDLLEAIHRAAHESGFDFSRVDPHLGKESRAYLLAWDDFCKTKTPGLTGRR